MNNVSLKSGDVLNERNWTSYFIVILDEWHNDQQREVEAPILVNNLVFIGNNRTDVKELDVPFEGKVIFFEKDSTLLERYTVGRQVVMNEIGHMEKNCLKFHFKSKNAFHWVRSLNG